MMPKSFGNGAASGNSCSSRSRRRRACPLRPLSCATKSGVTLEPSTLPGKAKPTVAPDGAISVELFESLAVLRKLEIHDDVAQIHERLGGLAFVGHRLARHDDAGKLPGVGGAHDLIQRQPFGPGLHRNLRPIFGAEEFASHDGSTQAFTAPAPVNAHATLLGCGLGDAHAHRQRRNRGGSFSALVGFVDLLLGGEAAPGQGQTEPEPARRQGDAIDATGALEIRSPRFEIRNKY